MSHAPSFEKILVTGGTGFIGQHLLRTLVAANHQPVAVARDQAKIASLSSDLKNQVRWIESDLLNHAATREVIESEKPTVIFHLAATRGRANDEQAMAACTELNVDATVELFESAQSANVERVIILGSADEYGAQAGPFKEDFDLKPTSAYAISKAEATRAAQAMHAANGFPVVVLRPFTVYGPQQPRVMFVANAVECAVNGLEFEMTAGAQKRDLVYVDDAVRAMIAAAKASDVDGKVINIGSGDAISLREVARLIWQISESDAPLRVGAREAATDEIHDTWADITRARQLLDWEPRVGLKDGLRLMIEWAREQKLLTTEDAEVRRGISSTQSQI
jgi:nucleoside-diphosphate-sugar epimerase